MNHEIDRRLFIRSALAVGAVTMADAALPARSLAARAVRLAITAEQKRYFAPVKVARNRLIRTVVGLRPYRSEGFVVDAERFGEKLLVHNYGHGGAGVTLSWGTSSLAVDLARDFDQAASGSAAGGRSFAVIGCGVMGLTTARLLQRRLQGPNSSVTIYAKSQPPDTTSNVAGAFWFPTSVFDPQVVTTKFSDQFRVSCVISQRAFQTLVGADYGVRWIETFQLLSGEPALARELEGGAHLYPETITHKDPKRYFGVDYVRQFNTMMIEPQVYLNALLRDFYVAGGKIVAREFQSRDEIARLTESVIFNCTGLGSRALFNDQKLFPVRGQLEVLLPQPEIDYCYLGGSEYMFPRRDGIILGGTWDRHRWELEPDPEQTAGILESHAEVMKRLKR